MEQRGHTGYSLAPLVGVAPQTINAWARGEPEPSAKMVARLAQVLRVKRHDFAAAA